MAMVCRVENGRPSSRLVFAILAAALICAVALCHPKTSYAGTGNHFIWSIETDRNTIYLLGSIHVLKIDSVRLPEEVEIAYRDSKKIVFETDLDSGNNPAVQTKIMALGLLPPGKTLEQEVSSETYRNLKEKVDSSGLQMFLFEQLKPWFCALTLATMELQRLGFDPSRGIDMQFFNKSRADGKEMIFLEDFEYQLNLFAKMDKNAQEAFLQQTIKDLGVVEATASDMVTAWETGDAEKLHSILKKGFEGFPDMYDLFILERNKQWAAQIEALANQDDNVLVVVGAGHLVGSESLLDLLRSRGYQPEQL